MIIYCLLILFTKFLSGIPPECQKSLDPDQDQCFIGPDLGPNCLQSLSAYDTNRRRYENPPAAVL